MKLSEILYNIEYKLYIEGKECLLDERIIKEIVFDSRKASNDCIFVAQKGVHVDGHKYISSAIEQGCKIIICQVLPDQQPKGVLFIKVDNSDIALGLAASNLFGNPSSKLKLIGITGTYCTA